MTLHETHETSITWPIESETQLFSVPSQQEEYLLLFCCQNCLMVHQNSQQLEEICLDCRPYRDAQTCVCVCGEAVEITRP